MYRSTTEETYGDDVSVKSTWDLGGNNSLSHHDTSPLLNNDNVTRHPAYPNPYGSHHDITRNKLARADNIQYRNIKPSHIQRSDGAQHSINTSLEDTSRCGGNDIEFVAYTRRWYILLVFWFLFFTQALAWNTWGPIALTAKDALGWDDATIALLSNWGCITYVCSAFFFSWLLDTKGLRVAVMSSAVLNLIGTTVRCLPVGLHNLIWTANLGQIFIGLAAPVMQGGVTAVSAAWFPSNQRTTSTAIMSVAGVVGTSFSFLIGPQIVTDVVETNSTCILPCNVSHFHAEASITPEVQQEHYQEIMKLMYTEFGISLLFCLLTIVYFPAKPPTPPSVSASTPREDFKVGALKLLRHREFWLLGMAYSLTIGVGTAWLTQIVIIFKDTMDVEQDTTTMLTFYASLTGIIGAILISSCIDFFGCRMKLALLFMNIAAIVVSIWYLLLATQTIPFNLAMIYVSVITFVLLMNGTIPLYYEISVEASYPIAEGLVTLSITWLMNVFGLVFLFILMIPDIEVAWMNYVLFGAIILSLPLIVLHREGYVRRSIDISSEATTCSWRIPCMET